MVVVNSEMKFCFACMKKHLVKTVRIKENILYKNKNLSFYAEYEECEEADAYIETEKLIRKNQQTMIQMYDIIK